MTTTKAMLERSETLARENEAATAKRTQYVILTTTGFYARNGTHWTNKISEAMHFDFMTSANGYAFLVLHLSCDDFTVEPV